MDNSGQTTNIFYDPFLNVECKPTPRGGPPGYNPFNPSTTIEFSLTKREKVLLEVYNILGERVVTLVDRELVAGEHIIEWDGKDTFGEKVSSGLYFYRLVMEGVLDSKKMLLLK